MKDTLLRQRAQAQWYAVARQTQDVDRDLTPEATRASLHELQVHQIELEMQNEELRRAQAEAQESRARYIDLYDLAPVGYCTLAIESGLIVQANLTLVKLLGVERRAMTHRPLSRFIVREDQDVFYQWRGRLRAANGPQSCDLRMVKSDGQPLWFRLVAGNPQGDSGEVLLTLTDIRAEKQGQAAQRWNAAALKAISQGVVVATPDFLIVTVNAAFAAITGYSEAETVGRNCNFLQGPDTDPHTVGAIRAALRQRRTFDGEILNYRKDGRPFWNALTISPVLDPQGGGLTHFVGVTRDITESVNTRQALEQSYVDLARANEMLEHTGALAKVGGWQVDLPSMKLSWTKETFRIAGIESPMEPPLEQGINLFAPEARPTLSAAVQAAIDNGTPYDLELPIIAANGQRKWVRTQGFGDMHNGKVVRIYGTLQDITERMAAQAAAREGEAFVRAIVDSVPGMLAYWGNDLVCRFTNRTYLSWLGRTSEEMAGIGLKAQLGDALYERDEPFVRAVLAGENQQFERELTMANGDSRQILAQYIAHWKDGKVAGFLSLVTDISEVKKVQQSLALSMREQQALLKEVHHRVKNNLQVITSLLRMEGRRSSQPQTKLVLEEMQGRIRAMALLHESLYRSSTFASVQLSSYLGQLATQAFRTMSSDSNGIALKLDLAPVQVGMDQAIPCGLLVNELISNCLKHAFPHGRSGTVGVVLQAAAESQGPGAKWRLCVSDTGVGLPADFDERRKTSLGLQLVDDLSAQLGGTMTIDSAPDRGARFTVVFALEDSAPAVMPA